MILLYSKKIFSYLAALHITGLNAMIFRKFIRSVFNRRYSRPEPQDAHEKFEHFLDQLITFIRKNTRSNPKVENILRIITKKVGKIINKVQDFRKPFRHLQLDDSNTEKINIILENCDISGPVSFTIALPFWEQAYVRKISEGAYGEIYQTENLNGHPLVLKIVAIHGIHPESEYENLNSDEVATEVVAARKLHELRRSNSNQSTNFPELYSVFMAMGQFPKLLFKSWETYKMRERRKRFHRPNLYHANQLFLLVKSSHCGEELLKKRNLIQSKPEVAVSLICQLVASLSAAEKEFQFEHRNCHMSNVLLRDTDDYYLQYTIDDLSYSILTKNYMVFIIDFSMSRLTVDGLNYFLPNLPGPQYENVDALYPDWRNHRFIYEKQAHLCHDNWAVFRPYTNILWLKHIIENVIGIWNEIEDDSWTLEQRQDIQLVTVWNRSVLNYSSAIHFFKTELSLTNNYVTSN